MIVTPAVSFLSSAIWLGYVYFWPVCGHTGVKKSPFRKRPSCIKFIINFFFDPVLRESQFNDPAVLKTRDSCVRKLNGVEEKSTR